MYYTNGDIYQGTWVKDKREGKGKLFLADGSICEATWTKDSLDGSSGVFIDTEGNKYTNGTYSRGRI